MSEPVWIGERDVLALHDRLLALDGGAAGLRDAGLLQSALARPRQLHACGDHPEVIDMAAVYITGIVRNHPFVDGNKRTGYLIGVLFLELNGFHFSATEESAARATSASPQEPSMNPPSPPGSAPTACLSEHLQSLAE